MTAYREEGDTSGEAHVYCLTAQLYLQTDKKDKAAVTVRKAMTLFQKCGDQAGMQFADEMLKVAEPPVQQQQIVYAQAPPGAAPDAAPVAVVASSAVVEAKAKGLD